MRSSEFCYWLQGHFEISGVNNLDEHQTEIVKRHLDLVFVHDLDPKQVEQKLQDIHDGKPVLPSTNNTAFRC